MHDAEAKLFILSEAVIEDSRTSPASLKAILLVIAAHERRALTVRAIEARAGLSRASVMRGLTELESLRLVGRIELAPRTHAWSIDWDRLADQFTEEEVSAGVDLQARLARAAYRARTSMIASSRRKGVVDGAPDQRDGGCQRREVGYKPAGRSR